MFRIRHRFLLSATGAGSGSWGQKAHENENENESSSSGGGKKQRFMDPMEGISITQAYTLFGFQMTAQLTEKEINARYKKLAKSHHPDVKGGDAKMFQQIKAAQDLLLKVKHEAPKQTEDGKANVKFTRANRADAMGTVDATNVDTSRNVDVSDAMALFFVFPLVIAIYYWQMYYFTYKLSDARSRMGVEEIRPQKRQNNPQHEWHPWRATPDVKDQVTEALDDRKKRLGIDNDSSGYVVVAAEQQQQKQQSPFALK